MIVGSLSVDRPRQLYNIPPKNTTTAVGTPVEEHPVTRERKVFKPHLVLYQVSYSYLELMFGFFGGSCWFDRS